MKKLISLFIITTILISLVSQSCKQKEKTGSNILLDSTMIAPFIERFPAVKKHEKDMFAVYRNYNYEQIWFDKKGIVEYGNSLYSKVKDIEDEGISTPFPYQKMVDEIFTNKKEQTLSDTDIELLLTSLYLYYVDKVYTGIEHKSTDMMGWLLPRKKVSYTGLLDSFISDNELPNEDSLILFSQYYKLRDVLKRYRDIEARGGWRTIDIDPDVKFYRPNDSAKAIQQIRERLFLTADISTNNGSSIYDNELVAAVKKYKGRNGFKPDSLISPDHILSMNVPVNERIKIIVVNMERCRWISPQVFTAKEYLFVNIPAYEMKMIRDGNVVFESLVVVGDSATETVIFGGKMSYIVFSPYWNLPKSIIAKEVMPGIEKNKNYLEEHDMEWNNGQVRQKPGKNNSLGLVKFMFPNSNDIYFHDTPSKNGFKKENRALSHGCVRVQKARELALTILQDDENWTPEKIDAAMYAGKESICTLKNKIPVHIGYFTSWVNDKGEINFYEDIYERDERLAVMMYYKE